MLVSKIRHDFDQPSITIAVEIDNAGSNNIITAVTHLIARLLSYSSGPDDPLLPRQPEPPALPVGQRGKTACKLILSVKGSQNSCPYEPKNKSELYRTWA